MKKSLLLCTCMVAVLAGISQNVGVGTLTPTDARLQVESAGTSTQAMFSNGTVGLSILTEQNRPSIGMNMFYSGGYKFKGAGWGSLFYFRPTTGTMTYYSSSASGAAGGAVAFSDIITFQADGNVGIGNSVPKAPLHVTGNVVFGPSTLTPATGYMLSVDGKIICEELKVQLSGSWPDYVFENSYPLIPLDELQRQVMNQKHLPGIPSAGDVEAQKGIELGDMQKRLLEKVEELYRYTFELNEKNSLLEAKILLLEQQLQKAK